MSSTIPAYVVAILSFIRYPDHVDFYREQGEWLRQNPRYARVLTAAFALLPRVLDEQHPRSPVIIP